MRPPIRSVLCAFLLLQGCAGMRDRGPRAEFSPRKPSVLAMLQESEGDSLTGLRDSVNSYPPTSRGQEVYRVMLALPPVEVQQYCLTMASRDKEDLLKYILHAKGKESYWTWKFQIFWDVPPREREFIRWYLREHTLYQPVPQSFNEPRDGRI